MAVTENKTITRSAGLLVNYLLAASTHLYEGTLGFVNPSGLLVGDTGSGLNAFAGIVTREANSTAGENPDLGVDVLTDDAVVLAGSGFSQASVGLSVYAIDNFTVTTTPTATSVYVGECVGLVSSTRIWVKLQTAVPNTGGPVSLAAIGADSAGAAALTGGDRFSVSAADGNKGVRYDGDGTVYVYNEHATAGLKVYPPTGGTINGGSTDAAITIEGKTQAILSRMSATNIAATFTANT